MPCIWSLVAPGCRAQANDVSACDSSVAAHVPGPGGTIMGDVCADGIWAESYCRHCLMNVCHSGTSGAIVWLAKLESSMSLAQSLVPCHGRALGQFDSVMSPSWRCMPFTTCLFSSPLNTGEPVTNSPIMQPMLHTSTFSEYRGSSNMSSTAAYQ